MFETHQFTLKNTVKCEGVGVHSGVPTTMVLKPAPANHGITFVRTDITDRPNVIPAKWDAVIDARLCTVLSNAHGVTISTVEHVLSALVGLGVDNAVIEIDGAEVPIMDGSAASFVFMIESAEKEQQFQPRKAIRVLKSVSYIEGDKQTHLSPADGSFFSFEIDFASKAVGAQKYAVQLVNGTYIHEISRARTFGFLHEVEALRKMGLARGGSLDNAIVIDGDAILNKGGLRYKNEFVRHKILDAIGDLYLAGAPILGHFHGVRAGHAMNNKILHTLFADSSAYEVVTLGEQRRDFTETHTAVAAS